MILKIIMKIDIKRIEFKFNKKTRKFYVENKDNENPMNDTFEQIVSQLNKIKQLNVFCFKFIIYGCLILAIISLFLIYFSKYFIIVNLILTMLFIISIFLYNKKFIKIDHQVKEIISNFKIIIEKNYTIKIKKSSTFMEDSKKAAIVLSPQINLSDNNCLVYIQTKDGRELSSQQIKNSLSKFINDNSYWLNINQKKKEEEFKTTTFKTQETISPKTRTEDIELNKSKNLDLNQVSTDNSI